MKFEEAMKVSRVERKLNPLLDGLPAVVSNRDKKKCVALIQMNLFIIDQNEHFGIRLVRKEDKIEEEDWETENFD